MAKQSRFKKSYRANASKLHKSIGDMLRSSLVFKNYKLFQEYPVNRVSPYYDSGREHFDWCIIDLQVVIECHGQQHYQPVRFGGITQDEAEANYITQQERDQAKRAAAEEAGWIYVIFKYDEDISIQKLLGKINDHKPITPVREEAPPTVEQQKENAQHREQLAKSREYRRQQYQKQKKWKKAKDADTRRSK